MLIDIQLTIKSAISIPTNCRNKGQAITCSITDE